MPNRPVLKIERHRNKWRLYIEITYGDRLWIKHLILTTTSRDEVKLARDRIHAVMMGA